MSSTVLSVPDISCEHCERAITNALKDQEGVSAVSVDIPGKLVKVEFDGSKIGIDQFKEILAEEEYPVESVVS